MTANQQLSIPDVADRHRRLVAFALLALGLQYALDATTYLVGSSLASRLALIGDGLALLVLALILPIVFWKVRNLSNEDWHLYRGADGFVARTIAQAHAGSWVVTFVVLALVRALDRTLSDVSWVLLFDIILAVMTVSFSTIYLYLDRTPSRRSEQARHA